MTKVTPELKQLNSCFSPFSITFLFRFFCSDSPAPESIITTNPFQQKKIRILLLTAKFYQHSVIKMTFGAINHPILDDLDKETEKQHLEITYFAADNHREMYFFGFLYKKLSTAIFLTALADFSLQFKSFHVSF